LSKEIAKTLIMLVNFVIFAIQFKSIQLTLKSDFQLYKIF